MHELKSTTPGLPAREKVRTPVRGTAIFPWTHSRSLDIDLTRYSSSVSRTNRCLVLLPLALLFAAPAVSPLLAAQDATATNSVMTLPDAVAAASVLIDDFIDSGATPGIAVSVGRDGHILWHDGFGFADLEQRVPIWPELTLFRVGSVAKPMTALAVAQLYEKGALDLDAPVQTYVPSFPEKPWPVTTRLAAGHLAGIRHYVDDEFFSNRPYASVLDGLTIFANDTLLFEPGTRFFYTTYGWSLVSAVVEGASAQDFLTYMGEHVFKPLGMHHTAADLVRPIILHRSRYYESDSLRGFLNSLPVDNSHKWAGGGFLSTADDLVRFGFEHLRPTTIAPETVELLWTSQQTTAGESTNYGIGWASGVDDEGRRWAGHTGGSIGGSTFFRIYPDSGIVVAVIANASAVNYQGLPVRIAELFMRMDN